MPAGPYSFQCHPHMLSSLQDLCVTNFGRDLRDGIVLGALIAAYWTGDSAGQLLSRLHPRAATARHLKENQEMVVKAMQVRARDRC
jgi:hypothetical protein